LPEPDEKLVSQRGVALKKARGDAGPPTPNPEHPLKDKKERAPKNGQLVQPTKKKAVKDDHRSDGGEKHLSWLSRKIKNTSREEINEPIVEKFKEEPKAVPPPLGKRGVGRGQ